VIRGAVRRVLTARHHDRRRHPDRRNTRSIGYSRQQVARDDEMHVLIINESAMRADVYHSGTDPLQSLAFSPRVEREVQCERVRLAPIEFVFIDNLRFAQMGGSDPHLRDIARLLGVSRTTIDEHILHRWIADLGLAEEWIRALALTGRE
jgi:hypothetical protein